MKITNTFITIADDSSATMGTVPPHTGDQRTIARLHYDLLSGHPYEFDIDSFNFEIYCLKNHIAPDHREAHRVTFFAKGHPCMRNSPLTKSYGFGAHYNGSGKIAIYPVDSIAYSKFLSDPEVRVERAMRSRRPSRSEPGRSSESASLSPGIRPQAFQPRS